MGEKSEDFWNGYHAGLVMVQTIIDRTLGKEPITDGEKAVLLDVITETEACKGKVEIVLGSEVKAVLDELVSD
ncbi:MAG: hypothetical protein M1161_02865 [Candidatus Thermoplasmatota archaeon]|jgi:hypothetical protein|nr:hypothetical protein [Candidatus Thermoplasmatota archaeon]